MALVLDTGPIVALLDASDPEHDRCLAMVGNVGEDLVIPAAVLIEVDYWLLKLYGHQPWQTLVEDIANGAYRLHPLSERTLARAAQLERDYASLDLGLVDASVIATCEELNEPKVATLDRRDFSVVRPLHRDHLTLLPE
ncbi:MAG TPA: PIN domain-containing protein [Solirubrobacteraceae bacterium]|nr:PIN domain-containing protein [Solirubrobacteraceae bacterium]